MIFFFVVSIRIELERWIYLCV